MKPFLILQLRPEDEASDAEFRAFLDRGGLPEDRAVRVRVERDPLPVGLRLSEYAGVVVGGGPGCVSDAVKPADEARAEATILSLYTTVMHWGAIIVAPGYTDPTIFAAGGNPYGFSTSAGSFDEKGQAAVAHQAKRLVEVTAKLAG